jgi:hypothetical protein
MGEQARVARGLFGDWRDDALYGLVSGPDGVGLLFLYGPKAVADDLVARRAFQKLVRAGVPPQNLARLLGMIDLLKKHRPTFQSQWARVAAAPSGMSRKKLRNLPRRLRDIAGKIKCVNEAPGYSPAKNLAKPQSDAKMQAIQRVLLRDLRMLPAILSSYAVYLEMRNSKVAHFRQGKGRREKTLDASIGYLIARVQAWTGRRHWVDIEEVLGPLVGDESGKPNADSLRMSYGGRLHRRTTGKKPTD